MTGAQRPSDRQILGDWRDGKQQAGGLLLLNVYIIEINLNAFLNAVLTLTWLY